MKKRIKMEIELRFEEFYSEDDVKELLYEQFLSDLTDQSDDLGFMQKNENEEYEEYELNFQKNSLWYTDAFPSKYEEMGKNLKEALEDGYDGDPVYISTIQIENQIFIFE